MAKDIQKLAAASFSAQEKDAALIRQTFKDGELLLKNVRTLMVGGTLLEDQKQRIKSVFADAALRDMLSRRFMPKITDDVDMALGVVRDIWIGAEQMIFGVPKETIEQAVKYKQKAMDFMNIALDLLEDPDGAKVPMKVLPYEEDPLQIELLARNMFIRHIDEQLSYLWLIANQAEPSTATQNKERRTRNSVK